MEQVQFQEDSKYTDMYSYLAYIIKDRVSILGPRKLYQILPNWFCIH